MGELSTVLYKVNWEYLIKHSLEKSFWKNKWQIFKVDNVKITLIIDEINVRSNQVIFRACVNDNYWESQTIWIPMDKEHFNEVVFNRKVYSTIESLLYSKESELIRNEPEYKRLLELDRENNDVAKDQFIENAKEVLGFEGLLNEAQRNALNLYVNENFNEDNPLSYEYLKNKRYRFRSHWFGLLALTLGTDEDYTSWVEKYGFETDDKDIDTLEENVENIEYKTME